MKVRAKFFCTSVTDFGYNKQAILQAAVSGSEENKSFSKYTPNGRLEISVDSDAAAGNFFVPKKHYYLDFEEASE